MSSEVEIARAHRAALGYRPDVDALRAVAVLAVFLFHLGIGKIPGGFVGVDVFYVISGFVIFRTLYRELDEQRFSPWAFYGRRVRRIMPALLLTLAASLVAGAVIMLPDDFIRLANSALATMASGANIYFFDRVDYFAPSVHETPLAHMWSLGIEEQFYLLLPLLAFAVTRFRSSHGLARALVIISLLSLAENLIAVHWFREELHAFYLPMARFWEIGAGGLLAWLEPRCRPHGLLQRGLAAGGLLGLVASFVLIDEAMLFPGVAAMLPVAATAAVIVAAVPATGLAGRVASMPPVLFLGRISYSLYLFHWPLIVFYSLYSPAKLSGFERAGILAVGIVLAWLSWRFVESRFRGAQQGGRIELRITGVAAVLGAGALAISLSDGMTFRLSPAARAVVAEAAFISVHPKGCGSVEGLRPPANAHLCTYSGSSKGFGYLLWGDSHARVLGKGLQQLTDMPGLVLDMSSCPSLLDVDRSGSSNRDSCRAHQDRALQLVQAERIPVVVLASRWATNASPIGNLDNGQPSAQLFDRATGAELSFQDALARTVSRFRALGAEVLIFGPVPESPVDVPKAMIRAAHLSEPVPTIDRATFDLRQREVLPAIAAVAAEPGVSVAWPHEMLCNADTCRIADGSTPFYADDDHLSLPGSLIAAKGLADLISKRAKRR